MAFLCRSFVPLDPNPDLYGPNADPGSGSVWSHCGSWIRIRIITDANQHHCFKLLPVNFLNKKR